MTSIEGYSFGQFCLDIVYGSFLPFYSGAFWAKFYPDIIGSTIYFVSAFMLIRYVTKVEEPKRLGWCLSAFNSCVLVPLAIPVAIIFMQVWFRETMNTSGVEYTIGEEWTNITSPSMTTRFLLSSQRLTEFLCIFFYIFMLLDLVLGFIYYRGELGIVTAWLHHALYMAVTMNVIAWKYSNGYMASFVEELPTIVLSLGHMYPVYRNDLAFGVCFFCTRILFHLFYLTIVIVYTYQFSFLWIAGLIALVLHVWWFSRWVLLMRKKEGKRKDMGLNADETDYQKLLGEGSEAGKDDPPLISASTMEGLFFISSDKSEEDKEEHFIDGPETQHPTKS